MRKIAILIVLAGFLFGCGGPTSDAINCHGAMSARDEQTEWTCNQVQQLGLWACTCSGPGVADQSTTDAVCAVAKECK